MPRKSRSHHKNTFFYHMKQVQMLRFVDKKTNIKQIEMAEILRQVILVSNAETKTLQVLKN